MATKLIAPNGVAVLASDADTSMLLAAGYTREKQAEPKKAAEKPAKKSKKTK